jgi:hypothetical protein
MRCTIWLHYMDELFGRRGRPGIEMLPLLHVEDATKVSVHLDQERRWGVARVLGQI